MPYSIYPDLSYDQFDQLRSTLDELKTIAVPKLRTENFKLTENNDDFLGLDFVKSEKEITSNVGAKWSTNQHAFEFYALSTKDENGRRYFKKSVLFQLVSISELKATLEEKLQACVEIVASTKESDLNDFVDLPEPLSYFVDIVALSDCQ
ncbi:MAG: hypothetical protein EOP04_14955 [Proteobacteria bacterium]|nr:MAG: hypothetical protein EOP04_14955 [Pseudomonadota bacterium]